MPQGRGCHPGEDLRDSSCQLCLLLHWHCWCCCTGGGGGCFGVTEGIQAQHRPVIGVGVSPRRVSTRMREFLVQGEGMWSGGCCLSAPLCTSPGCVVHCHPARSPRHPLPGFVPSVMCPRNPGGAGGGWGKKLHPKKSTRHESHARILPPRQPCSNCDCNSTASRAGS